MLGWDEYSSSYTFETLCCNFDKTWFFLLVPTVPNPGFRTLKRVSFLLSIGRTNLCSLTSLGLLFSTNSVLILTTLFPWILYFTARGCPWRTRIYMCMLSDSKPLFSNSVPIFCGFLVSNFLIFLNSVPIFPQLCFLGLCTSLHRGWWWRTRRQQAALKCTELPDSTQTRPHRRPSWWGSKWGGSW